MDNNNFTNKVLNDEYTALSTYRGKCNFDTLFRNPVPFKPKPTDEDYALGRITRFFVKKNTSSNFPIYEVDITQYEEFVKNSLYKNTYLTWTISGLPYSLIDSTTNELISGAFELNSYEINRSEKEVSGISNVFSIVCLLI